MDFKQISLFSGIGGFDLAAEWMGWQNLAHCEWNPFCRKILKYYWPKAKSYEDITKADFTEFRGLVDIVSGGFPCQPYSVAGKRKGKDDERHLWPQMLRAIREIKPPWVVGENVRGLVNWNGGLVFDEIQADLENEGYEVIPCVLPACGVEAPHQRDRIWFVAYAHDKRRQEFSNVKISDKQGFSSRSHLKGNEIASNAYGIGSKSRRAIGYGEIQEATIGSSVFQQAGRLSEERSSSDTFSIGLRHESNRLRESGVFDQFGTPTDWRNFPTQSPVCNGNDGISPELVQFTVSRRGKLRVLSQKQTQSKWRTETIKAGGNAIVPPLAYQIFKAIEEFCKIELTE